jgi:hypothetical protein
MRIDFRKIALVMAVTAVLAQVNGIYITLFSNSVFPWTLVLPFVIGVLLIIPFLVLLFLLYKTGTVPAVSGKLRTLAIAIALIYGARFVASNLYTLSRFDHREFLPFALNLGFEIVYFAFLVALASQSQGKPATNESQARLVWDIARLTLLAVWGYAAMRLVFIGISSARYEKQLAANHLAGGSARWIFHLQHAGGVLAIFCTAITVWILYMGLSVANEPFLKTRD